MPFLGAREKPCYLCATETKAWFKCLILSEPPVGSEPTTF